MRCLVTLVFLLGATLLRAQTNQAFQTPQAQTPQTQTPQDLAPKTQTLGSLPDSPGAAQAEPQNVVAIAQASFQRTGDGVRTCDLLSATKFIYRQPVTLHQDQSPCVELIYPYQRFLNTNIVIPLTWQQKGYLALHYLADPDNFGTILGISAITIGIDSHTAYGPGLKGFGEIAGVSLTQDATAQFFGVFAIPALVHQDPRYFRMPHAPLRRRILYSVSRTIISRSDSGRSIPNYATLLTYPINSVISNLYVPGIHPNGEATTTRSLTGIALDPANNLLTEFLPDVASHIHIRIIFVQTLLNNITAGTNGASAFQ